MKKLIELLNEYEYTIGNIDYPRALYKGEIHYSYYDMHEVSQDMIELYIISKRFGFIKWLVDNDKIDLGKLIMIKDEEQKAIVDIDNSRENTLLMLLAISDEPIEFLISILK